MRYLNIALLLIVFGVWVSGVSFGPGQVLGAATQTSDTIHNPVQISTKTAFSQKEVVETETIPFPKEYTKDKALDYGTEKVTREGVDGEKRYKYLITYWKDDVLDRQLVSTETDEPVSAQITQGTKITWNTLSTADVGRVKYWSKMRVFATKYDGNCYGCSGRTFSGTAVVKGVCATDPKVIPLGTNFYVVGYGLCRAEDIGGLIKGKRVDLGFVDAAKGAWGAAYTDVYLLTNAPTE